MTPPRHLCRPRMKIISAIFFVLAEVQSSLGSTLHFPGIYKSQFLEIPDASTTYHICPYTRTICQHYILSDTAPRSGELTAQYHIWGVLWQNWSFHVYIRVDMFATVWPHRHNPCNIISPLSHWYGIIRFTMLLFAIAHLNTRLCGNTTR